MSIQTDVGVRHTAGPWLYRPDEYDDWGVVRTSPDAEGRKWIICQARDPAVHDEADLNAHRRAGTDPWEANARLIASAPCLLKALIELADASDAEDEAVAKAERMAADQELFEESELAASADAAAAALVRTWEATKAARAIISRARGEA